MNRPWGMRFEQSALTAACSVKSVRLRTSLARGWEDWDAADSFRVCNNESKRSGLLHVSIVSTNTNSVDIP
jgi:hypothetical protein